MSTTPSAFLQLPLFPKRPESPSETTGPGGIERAFDVPFVSQLALKEKQIQQNYRPIIGAHKWFARRPGTLFRALLLSEFADPPLPDAYFRAHDFRGLKVADPFMGGGTPLLEANRLGFDVKGWDINPMAYWVVRQEIQHLDLDRYTEQAADVEARLTSEVGRFYRTRCEICGERDADVKYFLWIKTRTCSGCNFTMDLFPGYVLARRGRHPVDVLVCHACGQLNEVDDLQELGSCRSCNSTLLLDGPARRNNCPCPRCGKDNTYVDPESGPPVHRMFAIEYQCWHCKPNHQGRFFKTPDSIDKRRLTEVTKKWQSSDSCFVPADMIPRGDETDRLHRWGYRRYREMFNERQLYGLEHLCRAISMQPDDKIRHALATNLSDLLRYQNMLCRYDVSSLKSLDIFSVHGFPVGLIQCESNLLGIRHWRSGINVGSGGWSNIVQKFVRAKQFCDEPFEIFYQRGRKVQVPTTGEWIGEDRKNGHSRRVGLECGSATKARLRRASLDAVLTDPPYYANVQYAELMDFCYVWLRQLVGDDDSAFGGHTTRHPDELTGNVTMERDLSHFTAGLSKVFRRMSTALKPGAPLAFTYHHNQIDAYYPVAVAILDTGLTCSASLPCPAEMGGSIHIHSSDSSIIDTVFVCRSTGKIRRRFLDRRPQAIAAILAQELGMLRQSGVKLTRGDARCMTFGHLVRLIMWSLKSTWDPAASWEEKLDLVAREAEALGGFEAIEEHLDIDLHTSRQCDEVREVSIVYGEDDEVSF